MQQTPAPYSSDITTRSAHLARTSPRLMGMIRLLAILGMAGSAVLFFQSSDAQVGLPGCGEGSGCDSVLNSSWSKWFGIPVAAPAIVIYACVLAASLHINPPNRLPRRKKAWLILLVLAGLLICVALWFTWLQIGVIGAFCKYCTTVHAIGTVLAVLIAIAAPIGPSRLLPRAAWATPAAGILGVLLLAGEPYLAPAPAPPPTPSPAYGASLPDLDSGPGPDRSITVLNQRIRLKVRRYPVIGSPDAPTMMLYLFDYSCPECRLLHHQLEAARKRYGDQLGIVCLPAPLNSTCNAFVSETVPGHEDACELSQLALAVWSRRPGKFAQMHAFLMTDKTPPTPEAARAFAETLVPAAQLDNALEKSEIARRLNLNGKLYALLGRHLPQMIVGRTRIPGRPYTKEELFRILDELTAMKPIAEDDTAQ